MLATIIDGVPGTRFAVADRGLHYGDGLFETVRLADGRPCLWHRHLARLRRGTERLQLPRPDGELLYREIQSLAKGCADGVIKIILTRGEGARGYRPPALARPRRILSLYARPSYPAAWARTGVDVMLCRTPSSENPALAGLKHLNRLEQVLARAEWTDPAIAEGLMRDSQDHLVGGTMSNLFLVRGEEVATPKLDRCGVAGTVRAMVFELAPRFGLKVTERPIEVAELFTADAAFLTNAVMGAWSIRSCAGRRLAGSGAPAGLIRAVRLGAVSRCSDAP